MNDLLYQVALTMIPKVGPVTARNLISYCGGAGQVFSASRKELMGVPGIGEQMASHICGSNVLEAADTELELLHREGIRALSCFDKAYPERLRHYNDSPLVLYCRGAADLNAPRTVAIVGTRKPSLYGQNMCEEIVDGLQSYQVSIISGLAYGIDATAHRRCLDLGIPTIGVLGHGLGMIYPAAHRHLAEKMTGNGALLSEYTSRTPPEREHFPMRNRIIAAMGDALVVIETGRKGGSMISAFFANEYNKDVFALPGRVKDEQAQGCNHLIKSHRASLIESAADLAYLMRWDQLDAPRHIQPQLFVELSEDEERVISLLREKEVAGIDLLTFESKMTGSQLAAVLLELEFKGMIRCLPGKRYALA